MGAPIGNQNNKKEITWKVNKNGCWICTSHVFNTKGYPLYYNNGQKYLMHRFIYEKTFGKFNKNLKVCHKCDNPNCINPNHLFLGTQKENMQDMIRKGRQSIGEKHGLKMRGEENGSHKLTEKEVRSIKYDYPNFTRTEIAKIYNVSIGMISHILTNKNWKHI